LRRNRDAFAFYQLVPRVLSGVAEADLSARPLGIASKLPVAIAPTGFAGLMWRDGDLALAKAAARAGIPFVQSTVSNADIAEVAAIGGLHWFQLYMFRSPEVAARLLERAQGCAVLMVTVDTTAFGNREWDRRNYRGAAKPTLPNLLDMLAHPGWMAGVLGRGTPRFANLGEFLPDGKPGMKAVLDWTRDQVDAALDWETMLRLRDAWRGKLVIKGVAHRDDAEKAAALGADGIVLSNHGGRQLDGAPATLATLPPVAEAVGGRIAIFLDGGIRRGSDVVKALALGADCVLLGRAALYGLAAAGEDGAARAIEILREEIRRVMILIGAGSMPELRQGGGQWVKPV